MFSWQLRSKGLRPRRWLRTNKQHKRLLLANQEPNVFSFPPLYLQLNPLGHKVTVPAKDNNQNEVIILDSEVLGKWKPTSLSHSDPISRAGQTHQLLPILTSCSASCEHPGSPPEMPLSHRCLRLPAFQMAAGFLTSSPISLSPLGFHFNVILSHLFFPVGWCAGASPRGYQPAAPVACQSSPLQKCSHTARITNALLCPGCPAEVRTTLLRFVGCLFPCLVLHHWTYSYLPRAFLQGFSRLPGAAVGLFYMAQEGEWRQNRAENRSQAVISFLSCPPVTLGRTTPLWFFHL